MATGSGKRSFTSLFNSAQTSKQPKVEIPQLDGEISEGQKIVVQNDISAELLSHKHPNCLQFEIESEEIEDEVNYFYLNLKINFGLQKIVIDGWSISFGIKAGDLSLELENCHTSISENNCLVTTPVCLPLDRDHPKINSGVNNIDGTNPGWYFEQLAETSQNEHIQIFLDLKNWVKLKIENRPCVIKAAFIISSLDIVLLEYESIDSNYDYENKPKLIKALILKELESCKNDDGRYSISQVKKQYE